MVSAIKTVLSDALFAVASSPRTARTVMSTLTEYAQTQDSLVAEAAEAYPWDPTVCTHHLDVGRQHLFRCLSCPGPNAVCYACSIKCHTSHDLVEVGLKFGLRCDCGTTRLGSAACSLRNVGQVEPATEQPYSHNFDQRYCLCDQKYDESQTMYLCKLGLSCNEDWFHPECLGYDEDEAESELKADDAEDSSDDMSTSTNNEWVGIICPNCLDRYKLGDLAQYNYFKALQCAGRTSLAILAQPARLDARLAEINELYPHLFSTSQFEQQDELADESLLEGGLRALAQMHPELAHIGIEAYNELREKFVEWLENWDASKEVSAADIQQFIAGLELS